MNNALEWESKDTMKKSEITKNLKHIKKIIGRRFSNDSKRKN